jgi:hypothetical protein
VTDDWPPAVRDRLAADFGPRQQAAAALLPRRDDLPLQPPYEHVLRAVLILAEGDLGLLGHYAAQARSDWRDVLVWAFTSPDADQV